MFIYDECIDGDFFEDICDISWHEPFPDKKNILIYADTKDYIKALRIISQGFDRNFILVTHNGDEDVIKTCIPSNLIHWFAQNLNFIHPKISPIPIGLERQRWHPDKKNIITNSLNQQKSINRKRKALCQFNPVTFTSERSHIIDMVLNNNIYADYYSCLNGANFDLYIDNLTKYEYCLCPRGNGIDTHRLWESLYCGCIPITKKQITHTFDEDLPLIFIENWEDVTESFLNKSYKNINHTLFKSPILTKQYWKEKISFERFL